MASGTFPVNVNGAGMSGRISWSSVDNPGGNSSTVTATLQASKRTGFSTTFGTFSGYIKIDGVQQNFSGSVSIAAGNTNKTVFSKSQVVAHNNDGSRSVQIIVDGAVSGTSWTDSYGVATVGLTDYVRLPTTPTVVSYRSGDGATFRSDLSGSTFYGSGAAYRTYWRYANSGGWNGPYANSQNVTVDRYYKVVGHGHAYDSEGFTGAGEYYIPGVAAAPGTSVSKPARQSVAITVNAAPWNVGEADVTGYYSQHSLDNVNWDSPIYMTSNTLTYTGLAPGKTHYFRTFAVSNWYWGDMNNYSTFIPVGGKIHNGTSMVQATAPKVFNGTSWVDLTNAKIYNGTAWVDIQ